MLLNYLRTQLAYQVVRGGVPMVSATVRKVCAWLAALLRLCIVSKQIEVALFLTPKGRSPLLNNQSLGHEFFVAEMQSTGLRLAGVAIDVSESGIGRRCSRGK